MVVRSAVRGTTRRLIERSVASGAGGNGFAPGIYEYFRPGGTDKYLRPDGESLYKRPGMPPSSSQTIGTAKIGTTFRVG